MTDELDADDVSTHPFNFNNLSRAKDSMFQITTRKNETISGISSPWMYAGMLFASFCWHVEDLYMYAANYMHKGAAKTWFANKNFNSNILRYCVPSDHKEAFDSLIKEKYGELFIKDPNLLYEITLTMNPLELVKRNVTKSTFYLLFTFFRSQFIVRNKNQGISLLHSLKYIMLVFPMDLIYQKL